MQLLKLNLWSRTKHRVLETLQCRLIDWRVLSAGNSSFNCRFAGLVHRLLRHQYCWWITGRVLVGHWQLVFWWMSYRIDDWVPASAVRPEWALVVQAVMLDDEQGAEANCDQRNAQLRRVAHKSAPIRCNAYKATRTVEDEGTWNQLYEY